MTILEPNQPWPQVYFRRYKYLSFPFGYWEEGYEDKSIIDLTLDAKSSFLKNFYQPKTLFAGPRASEKIQDLISLDSHLTIETTALYLGGDLYRKTLPRGGWKGAIMTKKTTSPDEFGAASCSAWASSGKVMAEADQLEELIQLKLENPGTTREAALEWALEMLRLYASNGGRSFLGLDLILTVDDGLWMA